MTRQEFSSLALSYLEEVSAYAHRLCRSRSEWDADDLVQAAFERAFRSWEELADAATCRAWLFRITRNLHLDRVRQMTARSELRVVGPTDSVAPEPAVPAETVERLSARDLERALSRLPEPQREALLLCESLPRI